MKKYIIFYKGDSEFDSFSVMSESLKDASAAADAFALRTGSIIVGICPESLLNVHHHESKKFVIFFVNRNNLKDFVIIQALDLKDAILVSKSFSKASKCEILGVCRDCFKSFEFGNDE